MDPQLTNYFPSETKGAESEDGYESETETEGAESEIEYESETEDVEYENGDIDRTIFFSGKLRCRNGLIIKVLTIPYFSLLVANFQNWLSVLFLDERLNLSLFTFPSMVMKNQICIFEILDIQMIFQAMNFSLEKIIYFYFL